MRDAALSVAVLESCPVAAPLPRLSMRDGVVRYVRCQFPHYYVDVASDYQAYAKERRKMMAAVRRYTKRADGKVVFREYSTPEQMPEFLRAAREVASKTFQHKLLRRSVTDPAFDAQAEQLARDGRLRGHILFDFDGQRPIAYLCAFAIGDGADILTADTSGYDPDWRDWSPGIVLRALAVARMFDDDAVRIYDLSEGSGEHKQRLATHRRECAEIYFFRASLANLLIFGSHIALETVSSSAGRLLGPRAKTAFKRAVRRLAGAGPSRDDATAAAS
jgi:CelD/BcsL family acetyltransferase involved in cellulose biosynthesis